MLKLLISLGLLALASAQWTAHVFIQCDCKGQGSIVPGTRVEMSGFLGNEADYEICKKLCYKGYGHKRRSKRQAGCGGSQGFGACGQQGYAGTPWGYGFSQPSPVRPYGFPGPRPVAFDDLSPIRRPVGLGGDCAYGCTCGGCGGGICNWGCERFYSPVRPALAPSGAKIVPPFFAGRAHPFGPQAYGTPYGHASAKDAAGRRDLFNTEVNLNFGNGYGLNGYLPGRARGGPRRLPSNGLPRHHAWFKKH